jgi:type II secretory pathway predicted ATPase ExeA
MNPSPCPFEDFLRAQQRLHRALFEHHEPFALLTGKTARLRELRADIDRARYRVLYFAHARKLGAVGLIKGIGEGLRVRPSLCHALSLERLLHALAEDPRTLLLWLDEAHELPAETLAEARALTESDLAGTVPIQAQPALWRRIGVREEITGLRLEELDAFLAHHFPSPPRLCEQGLATLFERAKGVPGLLLPMCRAMLESAGGDNAPVDPAEVDDTPQRWDLA